MAGVRFVLCGLIATALWVSPSFANGHPRVGISAFGGYNTYSMGDINRLVGDINGELEGSGFSLDRIRGGLGLGIGVRVSGEEFLLAADLIHLQGEAALGVPDARLELEVPANGVMATAASLLRLADNLRFGLGIGVGYYVADAEISAKVVGEPDESLKLQGRGHGFHIVGLMTISTSRILDLEAAVGYRYAKTNGLKIDGVVVRGEDRDEQRIDWSGFMSRVGLIFYVTGR